MSSGIPLSDLKNKYLADFGPFITKLNGSANGPMGELRKNAIDAFNELGFPTIKNEDWKYTNLSKFIDESRFSEARLQHSLADVSEILENLKIDKLEAHLLVFCDSVYRSDLSQILEAEDPSIIISAFSEALNNNKDLISQYLGKAVHAETNGLTALNTAFASEGVFMHVPNGITPKYPVQLIFLAGAAKEMAIHNNRNLILIDENASLDLIETYASAGKNESVSNTVCEVFAGENAVFNQYRFQIEDINLAHHINFTGVNQQKNSLVNNLTLSLGGKLVRNDLNYRLDGSGCESHMNGLFIGTGSQHIDNHTLVDHAMPHCFSNEAYKGIMAEKGTGVFNGKVIVRQDAQKTNAYQSNKNILLSDDAHINTKPQLEIFANDVKCSHGATTGQLDAEALFYLQSRGIGKAEAKAMLTFAFAVDIIENIKMDALKEYAMELVVEKLETLTNDQ